jgi:GNAT superfamily N-acetyltransferase
VLAVRGDDEHSRGDIRRPAVPDGFVDEQTPELGIAVRPDFRGQKIGRLLLRAAIDCATRDAHQGLSLSVDPANPARRLYQAEGFRKVGEVGTSWTMYRELRGI